ncbi:DUF4258 domain-containing protein [Devosia lacusdianchii]|uniref:DUF4258 domain-containing protein n=1 Tax=Devosia lacusdianchii TaxID=2917991 RepID=UPI003B849AEA
MGKPLHFTRHALEAIRQRDLDLEWIDRAVHAPDWEEVDPQDPEVARRFLAVPERDNRYLRVACVETPAEVRILSAFFDRRARPK